MRTQRDREGRRDELLQAFNGQYIFHIVLQDSNHFSKLLKLFRFFDAVELVYVRFAMKFASGRN